MDAISQFTKLESFVLVRVSFVVNSNSQRITSLILSTKCRAAAQDL